MPRGSYRLAIAAGALLVLVGCSHKRAEITLNDNTLTVENQTRQDWNDVIVTVNDHFRGGTRVLVAGGRLTAPLSQFQTAYGQRFSLDRQTGFKVEVTATDARGKSVRLEWGAPLTPPQGRGSQ